MTAIVSGLATALAVWVLQPSSHTPPNMPAAAQGPAPIAAGAAGEGEIDARWRPWLGCWQLWAEQLDPSAADEVDDTAALLDRTLVCVRPDADTGGVRLTAEAGDQVLVDRTLVADGSRRDVQETDCAGWERIEWSADGRRLFTRAELQCSDQPARKVTGVSLLSSAATWADIQVIEVGGRQLVEVRRYAPLRPDEQDARRGPDSLGVDWIAVNQARRRAAAALDLPAVVDASDRTSARTVEALLVETEPTLPLDGDALIALDDAGISGGVTDLLVALAYPDRFVVERRDRGGAWSSGGGRGFGGFGGFHDPIWYSSYYPYYVTPLGYHFWSRGYYDPYLYGGFATPFVVLGGGGGADEPSGRAIPGVGFTRVSPRAWTGGGSGATPGGFVSDGGASRGGSSSGGSSGGAVSRGGFSSGGSSSGSSGGSSRGGSGGGRTAVPRR